MLGLEHNNSNGEIVLISKFNLFKQFFLKNCENCIDFINESCKLFFQEDV